MTTAAGYLDVRGVAARWGVSQGTIYRLVARRELPCVRVGRAVRFRTQDLEEYEQRSGGGREDAAAL